MIGRRLYSARVGLLAAALYAFAVLPLQQSHFYTVDTFGTFFALLTFYFCRPGGAGREAAGGGGWTLLALGAAWAPAWRPASTWRRWPASRCWPPGFGCGTIWHSAMRADSRSG